MPSTFRIPKADPNSLRGRLVAAYSRRTYGQVDDVIHVGRHHPRMMTELIGDLAVKAVAERPLATAGGSDGRISS